MALAANTLGGAGGRPPIRNDDFKNRKLNLLKKGRQELRNLTVSPSLI